MSGGYDDLPLFDLTASEEARNEALEQVTKEPFASRIQKFVTTYMRGDFTGEDIRREALARGIEPHHHNAWGGVIGGLVRQGVIYATGERRKMTAAKSKARKTDVYRLTEEGSR